MQLGQIKWNGAITAAIFNGTAARPIPDYTLLDLISRAEKESETLPEIAARLATRQAVLAEPLIPLQPREVWGCGCTYETSASFRDAEHGTREGFYAHVYKAARPEIFFKGTARVCVGPGQSIGIRADSKFTAPEPELALVL
jgi:2-dehydro-3-deoxy-D-arabinonate dehydratase